MSDSRKPVPQPTPETQEFWDAAQAGELKIQHCNDCDEYYFYPRPFCPKCGEGNVEWRTVSGRGVLWSYIINHRAAPGFEDEAPYAIAVVKLDEGPTMMTNIVGIENTPENLVLDMPLEVVFEDQGPMKVAKWRPAGSAA